MCLTGTTDFTWLGVNKGWDVRRRYPDARIYFAIDVADLPLLRYMTLHAMTWPSTGVYVVGSWRNGAISLARFLLMQEHPELAPGKSPHLHVDHRNGFSLDNRRANLRILTKQENNRNKWPYSPILPLPARTFDDLEMNQLKCRLGTPW